MKSEKSLSATSAERLYTVKEVAGFMSVSQKTIRNEIDAHNLGFTKVRGSLRIPDSEYRAYVERNTVRSVGNGR